MVLFVLRRHNDIDHMVPVIYRMAKEREKKMLVLSMDPLHRIDDDNRLRYLKEVWGVLTESIYKTYYPSFFHRIMAFLVCVSTSFKKGEKKGFFRFVLELVLRLYLRTVHNFVYGKIGKKYFFTEEWAQGLFQTKKVTVAVFDYAKKNQFITGALMDAANRENIPTVGMPHGLKMWSDLYLSDDVSLVADLETKAPFTKCIVSNRWAFKIYNNNGKGWPKEKLKIIGSARYCREWVNTCFDIFKPFNDPRGENGKLKVVFFEGGHRFLKNQGLVIDSLNEISKMKGVRLIVQPRPRNPRMPLRSLQSSIRIDSATSAFNLCRWADVVITGITSVFMEALVQKKVLLCPVYWHTRTTVLEEEKVGFPVSSLSDLKQVLFKLRSGASIQYKEENVENFLTGMVYGGKKGRDVLGDYCNFIFSVEHESLPK